jgi:maltooligosyltrehalose trehalohydrolase
VNALQTHDQVGNRAFGERLHRLAREAGREDALRALTACVLLAPSPPMLFMGEEYAADTPFLYFCDHEGELACAVADGRRAEFGRFERFADPSLQQRIPDPNAWSTFADSVLDWSERGRAPHRGWLELYTLLLGLRRTHLAPRLAGARAGTAERPAPGTLRIAWPLASRHRWHLLAQLSAREGPPRDLVEPPGEPVYRSHPPAATLPAWSVLVTLEAR